MTNPRKRVLVIGLDGGTFDLIEPWVAKGYLPNLAHLMSSGCRGKMASTLQPVSAPAWVTAMTGVNQGQHGLYDFVRRCADSYKLEVTNASMIGVPTVFDLAGNSGVHVVALNVPYTFPPRPVNGVMVSGPFAPVVDARLVYPSELGDKLMALVDGYFITPDYDASASNPLTAYASALERGVEYRQRLATYIMETELWDLFTVVFTATDQVQHFFWHCMEAPDNKREACFQHTIRDVYRRVDEAIGSLLERIGEDTTVIVLSDHGAGPLHKLINLNRWLAREGVLRFKSPPEGAGAHWKARVVSRLASAYRRHAPAVLRAWVRSKLGARRFERIKGDMETILLSSAIAWDETKAYALGAAGNIYLNVAGREPEGVVHPGREYEALRDELSDALTAMEDPETGQRIVRRVWYGEELYHGPHLGQSPDLVIEWVHYGYWGRARNDIVNAPLFEDQKRMDFSGLRLSGTHRRDGIFIISGPGIKAGTEIKDARIIDVAPTILAILGVPIPGYMDGSVLWDAFTGSIVEDVMLADSFTTVHTPPSQSSYTPEDAAKISQRLEDLGYL